MVNKVGIPGFQGPPGLVPRGEWAIDVSYDVDDFVTESGSAYLALKAHTGVQPGTDATTWQLYVASGDVSPVAQAAIEKAVSDSQASADDAADSADKAAQSVNDAASAGATAGAAAGASAGSTAGAAAASAAGAAAGQASGASAGAAAGATASAAGAAAATTQAANAAAAATAASQAAGIYGTTAAGLAAVASGKYFWVSPSANGLGLLDLYLNNSGTAVYYGNLPSNVALNNLAAQLRLQSVPGWMVAFTDSLSNIAGGFLADGTFSVAKLNALSMIISALSAASLAVGPTTISAAQDPTYLVKFMDALTNISSGLRLDGSWDFARAQIMNAVAGILSANVYVGKTARGIVRGDFSGTMMPDIPHVIAYGQSLSQGINSGGVGAGAVVTASQRFSALKFSGGVRAQDYSTTDVAGAHASFQPLVETIYNTGNGGVGGETPCGGTTDSIYERLQVENPSFDTTQLTLLGSAPGYGGLLISALSKGTAPYQRILDDVTYGLSLANAAGKTYRPIALSYTQGEADQQSSTQPSVYLAALTKLQTDLQTDIRAIIGDSSFVLPFFCYQMASWANGSLNNTYPYIPMQMKAFCDTVANAYMVMPMYMFDYVDQYHMKAMYYKVMGAYYGIAMKRVLMDKVAYKATQPTGNMIRQGTVLSVEFNVPMGKLVFDSKLVTDPGNYGFSAVDSSGNAKTITATPVIVNGNTVRLTCAAGWAAGDKLRYGFIGQSTTINRPGYITGNRGCLRDQQGDYIVFDKAESISWPMHNWSLMFELTLV
ncbi:hypothetical protein [Robbsia sp. KACC 23696]|uniref:hypothetical protein n=1 Tax=Robbsia sp. KACC 23696 TaxID=3149231 RepID=UPI00325BA1A6